MNVFFLILFMLLIILSILYVHSDKISGKIPRKDSSVFIENEEGCILVPAYVTKYVVGGRIGINISVDGIRAANVKPGDTVLIPVRPGIRRISAYWYESEKYDAEAYVDEGTMLFVHTEYDGFSTTTFLKELRKNDPIDESGMEKGYNKAIADARSLKVSSMIRVFVVAIPMLIAGIFLT
ncbi:MAG: hypothetical protein FWH44_03345 [Methanomassiliicoccaceae archaeon]|nr:hypothetical protein [Methanomassiliicoccaceae archaeon]